jgi:NifU-like protein involved in Fe-S cluster formation
VSNDPYNALVRDYFAHTAHAGDLKDGVVAEIAEQGIHLRLAATEDNGHIQALRFRAWGCPHVIAACESFCAEYEGKPLGALGEFQASNIMRNLSVPVEKTGRILVLEDVVRLLGRAFSDESAPH